MRIIELLHMAAPANSDHRPCVTMGHGNSVPLLGRRKSLRSGWRTCLLHRPCHRKGNLSATFNMMPTQTKLDQLNVNTASEEELMTLPGISRTEAHNIVNYRQAIGRFNKVEDLALVTGIGADKLALIRPEICVIPPRSTNSCTSVDSIGSATNCDIVGASSRPSAICVNTATVFDLQTLPGFSQQLAANVVHYRDRHGQFSSLDQLLKVKGINQGRLAAVKSRLSLSPDPLDSVNNISTRTSQSTQAIPNGKISGHRKTMSAPIKYAPVSNGLAVRDILDVLSACSQRPIITDFFNGLHNGRPALRVASWNLSQLSVEKIENPGVSEVMCRTILENRFSIIAVQGVLDVRALEKLCEELNRPSLRRVKEWKENSCLWKMQLCAGEADKVCRGLGFIWDSSAGIKPCATTELRLRDKDSAKAEALLAEFMLGPLLSVSLVNVQLSGAVNNTLDCDQSVAPLQAFLGEEPDTLVVLGDFTALHHFFKGGQDNIWVGYRAVLPVNTNTSALAKTSANGTSLYDNVFLNRGAQNQYTGVCGVVRQGLTHLAIPNGWTWGGPASEHCPVWCDFYIDLRANNTPTIKEETSNS